MKSLAYFLLPLAFLSAEPSYADEKKIEVGTEIESCQIEGMERIYSPFGSMGLTRHLDKETGKLILLKSKRGIEKTTCFVEDIDIPKEIDKPVEGAYMTQKELESNWERIYSPFGVPTYKNKQTGSLIILDKNTQRVLE